MAWIKLDTATPTKPEVLRMARRLGIDVDAIVGKLMRVWVWFDVNSTDGQAEGIDGELVDSLVGCSGFAAAMEAVGWLQVGADGVAIPKFSRHNGASAKERALNGQRAAKSRERRRPAGRDDGAGGRGSGHAASATEALPASRDSRAASATEDVARSDQTRGDEIRELTIYTSKGGAGGPAVDARDVWAIFRRYFVEKTPPLFERVTDSAAAFLFGVCALVHLGRMPEAVLVSGTEALRRHNGPVGNQIGYLRTVLREQCAAKDLDFEGLLKAAPAPPPRGRRATA